MFIEILKDTVIDCLKMLPFLLVAYFLIEYVERGHSETLEKILQLCDSWCERIDAKLSAPAMHGYNEHAVAGFPHSHHIVP